MVGTGIALASLLPSIIGAGGAVAGGLLGGRNQQQQGQQLNPANPELYKAWTDYLGGQIGQNLPAYGGDLAAPYNPYFGIAAGAAQPYMNLGQTQANLAQSFMTPNAVGAGQFVREMLPEGGSQAFQSYLANIPAAARESALTFGRGGTGYLEEIARTGIPVTTGPAWENMLAAQERGIQERGAQLAERTAGPGGRFGSSYNTAMTDYNAQTAKDQNALIAQMVYGAGEQAAGRRLGAATELGRQGLEGMNLGLTGAINAAQLQGSQEARDIERARTMLSGWGLDINRAQTGAQIANMGIPGFNAAMQVGGTGQQYNQDVLNRYYQEWLRTQPQNNPWNQYIGSAATQFPGQMAQYPQGPSPWPAVLQSGLSMLLPYLSGGGNANTNTGWTNTYGTPGGNPATLPQGQVPSWLMQQPSYYSY